MVDNKHDGQVRRGRRISQLRIDRDVGEHDAMGRHMTTNDAATYAMTQNGTNGSAAARL